MLRAQGAIVNGCWIRQKARCARVCSLSVETGQPVEIRQLVEKPSPLPSRAEWEIGRDCKERSPGFAIRSSAASLDRAAA